MQNILYKLTESQKRIWTTQQIYSEKAICNIGGNAEIHGELKVKILKAALKYVVESNDSFQIRFLYQDDIYQYFDKDSKAEIDYKDFSWEENPIEAFRQWGVEEMNKAFVFEQSPLYYICIYKINAKQYGYFIKLHHIIADGWSIQLISERVRDAYMKIKLKELPDNKSYSFEQYIEQNLAYLQSDAYKKDKTYWNTLFHDITEDDELPVNHLDNVEGKRVSFVLENSEKELIRNFCKENNVTLHTTMMLLLAIYFLKTKGINDIVIGSPTLGRCNRRERNIIGMFVSSLPIRCQADRTDTIVEMAKKISNRIKESFKHQMYPYNHLIKDLESNQNGGYKLYDVCVNYYSTYLADRIDGMEVECHELYNGQQDHSLQMIVREWSKENKIQLDFDYQVFQYKEEEINAIYQGIKALIELLPQADQYRLMDICLLNKEEYQKLVVEYNETNRKWEQEQSVWELFEKQVLKFQNKVALSCGQNHITYGELHQCVMGIAQYLSDSLSDKNYKMIGIYMSHSIETVAVILGAIKAGVIYVPLDIHSPLNRIDKILNSACIDMVITNIKNVELQNFSGKIYVMEDVYQFIHYRSIKSILTIPNENIYTIFTSGSTGTPKGVLVKQSGLVNYLNWAKDFYNVKEADAFPLFTSLAFDLTVTSILLPMISGATIRIYQPNNGLELETIFKEDVCTIIKLTPSHLTLLEHFGMEHTKIHTMIVGGEDLKASVADAITKKWGDIHIFNEYGPTECTIGCMIYLFDKTKFEAYSSVPIGKPIANTQIYILDKDYQPVPMHSVGEMYVGGDGLATGYVNEKELTLQKFCTVPTFDGKLLYKTGDLAKFIDDSTLIFYGRKDNQLKIRGYRIEIGEIERRLSTYEKIDEFALKMQSLGKSELLCLYYTADNLVEEEDIKCYLEEGLPSYMIPSCYIYLEAMPLTLNGKLDTNRLPQPQIKKEDREVTITSKIEKELVQIAEKIFGYEIDINDNFYKAGGDSIKAIQLSYKLREKGYSLKMKDILERPCFIDMALFLTEQTDEEIKDEDTNGKLELTPILNWFFTQNLNQSPYYQAVELQFKKMVTRLQIQKIITQLFHKHDIFKLIYQEGELFYTNKEAPLIEEEWLKDETDTDKVIQKQTKRLGQGLDISTGKIFAAKLFHTNTGDILVLAIHHICVDGVSWRIILDEIDRQFIENKNLQNNIKIHSYMHYAKVLQSKKADIKIPDESYLFEVPETSVDYSYQYSFSKEEVNGLFGKANETYNTNPFELLLAAMTKTMKNRFLKPYQTIELESHGRQEFEDCDILHTVGWFTVLYPYFADYDFSDLSNLIIRTKELYRAQEKQMKDYAISHEYSKLKKRPFLRFNYLGEMNTEYSGFSLSQNIAFTGKCTNPLEIDCINIDGGLKVMATGSAAFIEQNEIKSFIEVFFLNLQILIKHCLDSPKQFTPVDFETVDLSQEDLQRLFD